MFSPWLGVIVAMVTMVVTAPANPDRVAVAGGTVSVGPTSKVKGHLDRALMMNCGDGKSSGLVQFWHTPFGVLQRPGVVKGGVVSLRSDGVLVVSNCSRRHSGLYYCLLQDAQGTALWSYQVQVHPDHPGPQEVQVRSEYRGVLESEEGVSQQELAAAVTVAVLLTFVVGFSAGALSRTQVLRCLGTIRTKIRSPWQHSDHTDCPGVTMTTLPPWYGHQGAEPVDCEETMETTVSSSASSPPIKPQRSFRHRGGEEEEPKVYLEGCGHSKREEEEDGLEEEIQEEEVMYGGLYLSGGEEEEREEEERGRGEKERRRQEEEKEDEEEEQESQKRRQEEEKGVEQEDNQEEVTYGGLYMSGGDEEEREDEEEERRREKESQNRQEEKGDEEEERSRKEKETQRRRQEDEKGDEEKEEERREKETKSRRKEEEEEEVHRPHSETSSEGEVTKPEESSEPRGRRSRIIRLYQYDEEGQRYGHLPDPDPEEPRPAPRLRQRSVSLTRLNTIMAAASAGPMDSEGDAGRREETHFHMDI